MNIVEHELHHGASQYLLMDSTKFVSFDEVAFPLMLTALPLGVEAAKELSEYAFDAIVLQKDIPHTIVRHFLYVLAPMAFGGLSVYACFFHKTSSVSLWVWPTSLLSLSCSVWIQTVD